MYWTENLEATTEICNQVQEGGSPSWLLTVRGTTHFTLTDISLLYSKGMSRFLKRTADPMRALDLSVGASLEFLLRTLAVPLRDSLAEVFQDRGMLDAELDVCRSSDQRPDPKYTGMRLKLKKEARYRALLRLRREQREQRNHLHEPANGEIWMHVKPSTSEIASEG